MVIRHLQQFYKLNRLQAVSILITKSYFRFFDSAIYYYNPLAKLTASVFNCNSNFCNFSRIGYNSSRRIHFA